MQAVIEEPDDEDVRSFQSTGSQTSGQRPRPGAVLMGTVRLTAEIAAYSIAYLLVVVVCFGAVRLLGLI